MDNVGAERFNATHSVDKLQFEAPNVCREYHIYLVSIGLFGIFGTITHNSHIPNDGDNHVRCFVCETVWINTVCVYIKLF